MNKILFVFLFLVFIYGKSSAQSPYLVFDQKSGEDMYVGVFGAEHLSDEPFGKYYNPEYNYQPNIEFIEKIKNLLDEKKDIIFVSIVLGTWCSDSRQQVPRFMKIYDMISSNLTTITLIGVDRSKETLVVDISELKIEKVPTIIIYRNNFEIGRIVETPTISLEEDFFNIIK